MVQALFYIRFRDQLRRTRPGLIAALEDTITASASYAGGNVETGRRGLVVSFNEERIGFWLDIVIFIEKVHHGAETIFANVSMALRACSKPVICRSLSITRHGMPFSSSSFFTGT